MALEQISRRSLELQLIPDDATKKQIVKNYLVKGLPYRFENYASFFGFQPKGDELQHTHDVIAYWEKYGEYTSGTPMPWFCWDAEDRYEKEAQQIHLEKWTSANEFIKHHFLSPFLSVPFYRFDTMLFNHSPATPFALLGETKGEDGVDGFVLRGQLSSKPEDDVAIKLAWNNGVEWKFYDELLKKIGLSKTTNPNSRGLKKLREHLNKKAIDDVRQRIAKKLEHYPRRETMGGLDHRIYAQVYAQATAHAMYPEDIPQVHSVFTYDGHLVGFATQFKEGKTAKLNDVCYEYPHLAKVDEGLERIGIYSDPYGQNVIVPSSGRPQIIDLDLSRRTIG